MHRPIAVQARPAVTAPDTTTAKRERSWGLRLPWVMGWTVSSNDVYHVGVGAHQSAVHFVESMLRRQHVRLHLKEKVQKVDLGRNPPVQLDPSRNPPLQVDPVRNPPVQAWTLVGTTK